MKLVINFYKFFWQQKWIDLKLKKSIYKKLAAAGEPVEASFTTDFYGLKYDGNLSNNIEFNIYYFGAFEKPLLYFLRDTLSNLPDSRSVFCDIGANIGQHSLFVSTQVDEVHAFEPYNKVSQRLRHHIALNEIDNIKIHEVGLSDNKSSMNFYAPTGRNQGIGSFDASTVSKGNKIAGKLNLVRGDDYLTEQSIDDISLMKIDVEGFEKLALAGLQQTLSKWRPIIVCEISYGGALSFQDLDEFEASLPPDYTLFTFDIRKPDGRKARRKGARAKHSGDYSLIPFTAWRDRGQDDVIACPVEKLAALPRRTR